MSELEKGVCHDCGSLRILEPAFGPIGIHILTKNVFVIVQDPGVTRDDSATWDELSTNDSAILRNDSFEVEGWRRMDSECFLDACI